MPQTLSVSWFLLVTTITGMCLVASSRVIARVAGKPLVPGMTTSIRMRSGFSDFDLVMASSPFSAVTTWYPCLDRVSMKNCRSVGESSTIKIFFTAMAISSGTNGRVRPYGFQKTILREGLGQVFVRAHHSATRPVKQAVLGRQHDHGGGGEVCVFLDQRAGLIPVEARHHDVHENDIGLVVGDLGERIEPVFGEDHLATGLNQENLSAAANCVRIVDHHHFDARKTRGFAHALRPHIPSVFCSDSAAGPSSRSDAGAPSAVSSDTIQPNPVKTKPCAFYFRSTIRVNKHPPPAFWAAPRRKTADVPDYISTISKSSFRAPHSGQVPFIGMSSQRVPGGSPSSGNPVASS